MLEKFLEAAAITLLLNLMPTIYSPPDVTQGALLSHQIIPLAGIPNANGESAIQGGPKHGKVIVQRLSAATISRHNT